MDSYTLALYLSVLETSQILLANIGIHLFCSLLGSISKWCEQSHSKVTWGISYCSEGIRRFEIFAYPAVIKKDLGIVVTNILSGITGEIVAEKIGDRLFNRSKATAPTIG